MDYCGCGRLAVGRCVKCRRPLCEIDTKHVGGQLYCSKDADAHYAARQREQDERARILEAAWRRWQEAVIRAAPSEAEGFAAQLLANANLFADRVVTLADISAVAPDALRRAGTPLTTLPNRWRGTSERPERDADVLESVQAWHLGSTEGTHAIGDWDKDYVSNDLYMSQSGEFTVDPSLNFVRFYGGRLTSPKTERLWLTQPAYDLTVGIVLRRLGLDPSAFKRAFPWAPELPRV